MTNKQLQCLDSFLAAVAPTRRVDIVDWAADNVALPYSAISPHADLTQTPYLVDPLRAAIINDHHIINMRSPIGSGKSTMLEVLTAYYIAVDSGSILIGLQSITEATNWVTTRMLPCLRASEPTAKILDICKRHDVTQERMLLPHMEVFMGSASSKNFLQSKSVPRVFLDECWILPDGSLREALGRHHDRWNKLAMFVSQGGNEGNEFSEICNESELMDYHWRCVNKKCKQWNIYRFEDLHWDKSLDEDGNIIWKDTLKTVRMECPCCGKKYKDTPANRRKLSQKGEYFSQENNHITGQITYCFNALAIIRVKWATLVQEFLKAQISKKKGDITLLQQFNQKRLAQDWSEKFEYETKPLIQKAYKRQTTPFPNEIGRIMSADVGGDKGEYFFWVIIRAWFPDGESRLVYEGRINSIEELIELHKKFNIPPNSTFMDVAWSFDKTSILQLCAEQKWYGLDGKAPSKKYDHGKAGEKFYSKPKTKMMNGQPMFKFTYFAHAIKDILDRLKSGNGATWELCKVSKIYEAHMSAEIRKETAEGSGIFKWDAGKRDNHLFDAEVMNIVGSMIKGWF